MLLTRVLTGVLGIAVLVFLSWLGGAFWAAAVAVIVLIAAWEMNMLLQKKELGLPHGLWLAVLLFPLSAWLAGRFAVSLSALAVFLLLLLLSILAVLQKEDTLPWALGFFSCVYVGWTLSFLILLRQLDEERGFLFLLTAFLITWLSDTGAYLIGRAYGRHKLIPAVSPKKSWEGVLGGLAFCLVGTLIYNAFFLHLPFWLMLIAALCGTALGIFGDLAESLWKRWAGVKDSGKILPGHGGMLDRFDSMMLVAPFLYFLFQFYLQMI